MIAVHSSAVSCPTPARPRSSLKRIWAVIGDAMAARRQRDRLIDLDPRLLEDIGLTPRMAEDEAARPLWDVPKHWLK